MPARHRIIGSGVLLVALFIVAIGAFAAKVAAAAAAAATTTTAAQESNWPQWRGPLATGAAPTADPPINWGEGKNVRWKVKVPGRGTSTPIVWGDSIFVQTAIATAKPAAPAAAPVGADAPVTTMNEATRRTPDPIIR